MSADTAVVKYAVTDAILAEMRDMYMPIRVTGPDDNAGFKAAHEARMVVKGKRCEIEKARVELKADALEYGRRVDAEAKRITKALTEIEDHLTAQERVVTDAIEKKRREKEEAERLKAEAEERARKAAEEAEMQAERERMVAEQAKLQAERQRLERIAAAQLAASEKIEAEQRRLAEAEQAKQRAAELERAKAEAAAKAQAETEARIAREAEEARLMERDRKLKEECARVRAEAMRPDAEKLAGYGLRLLAVEQPKLSTLAANGFLGRIVAEVRRTASKCAQWKGDES